MYDIDYTSRLYGRNRPYTPLMLQEGSNTQARRSRTEGSAETLMSTTTSLARKFLPSLALVFSHLFLFAQMSHSLSCC